jgi:cell wall-associated NlpC family hydrolase
VKPHQRPGIFACPNPTGHPSQAVDEGLRMTARTGVSALLSRVGATSALTAAAMAIPALLPGLGSQADAATLSIKALNIAASKKGSPYKYGAAGPKRFDCSGLVLYSYKRAGKKLPRTAASQYNKSHHLSASHRKVGDLVFFHYGRSVYHVGIYAGHNKIWHSPKPGTKVRLEKIWTRSVWYGRVS